ncbi:hypothetical protein [Streptococcus vestibularis]|jgi:uncharacterized membrane protein|uniref:hypothetical protein n=1 Tax=Streptococcus vestibularis TaxID=1343 RepID=UPI0028FF102E|nr:hypothetical protein [Streptococcus vestibularis]MDU1714241.1 hypothetical protein [Streptococcus vestibularis]MDU1830056.1 hypothetical protein [Streptococcus vestibularis]MDU5663955.1 hypothetical protein [Streptococcus vestibularis]
MKLKNISSSVLRSFRTITAALAVFLISISISLYKSKTSPEIWLAVGALALVVIFVNGLLYRLLKKRPDSVNQLTIQQSFIVFLVITFLVLCVEFYTLLTFSDTTDRIMLVVLMLLLILCDFLAYLQVKKYFKK